MPIDGKEHEFFPRMTDMLQATYYDTDKVLNKKNKA